VQRQEQAVPGTAEAIQLGIVLASVLGAFAFLIAAETAQKHEITEHEEELAGDFFFVGIVCVVAAVTGIVYFISIGRDADQRFLPALFFLYLVGGIAYFVVSLRLLVLASISTRQVQSRLSQGINLLLIAVVLAVLASIFG
jgi:uncharacterized membrane protein